ncbi:MAG: hypothetical protein AMXMBFR53_13200 [Gemmatimonadota bacterium]
MAGRLSNSWTLVKASADVLRLDKELMVFPLLSGIATVLVTASFFVPVVALGGLEVLAREDGSYLGYALGFAYYLVLYTVMFFFNSALVGAALIRLDGGDPTVSDGLAIASKRMGAIVGYAAVAATVGMVLRAISERSGIVGRIVVGLVGMAWTLATYLAVPVLVTRDVGPIDAVKESAALFKKTWGEQVAGNFGMGWAMVMAGLSWGLVSVLVIVVMAQISPALVLAAVAVAVLGFVFLALLASALKGIYTAALYRYAVSGETGFFDDDMVARAFSPRR